jgi:hypothetical protein
MNFARLEFRFNPARADETPTADRFKNGKQSSRHKNQSPQRIIAGDDDSGNEAQRADDAARQPAMAAEIGSEEFVHTENLARRAPKAKGCPRAVSGTY